VKRRFDSTTTTRNTLWRLLCAIFLTETLRIEDGPAVVEAIKRKWTSADLASSVFGDDRDIAPQQTWDTPPCTKQKDAFNCGVAILVCAVHLAAHIPLPQHADWLAAEVHHGSTEDDGCGGLRRFCH
jgi:hypothetical protein